MRCYPLLLVALAIFVMLACGASKPEELSEQAEGSNLVLFVVDTLRPDHLGSYGSTAGASPTLDRLAEEAYLYEQVYASSSWTKTSVASLLTGVSPHRHGAFDEGPGADGILPAAATTLAERLRDAGFHTAAVAANPHLRPELGFAQGFETFVGSELWAPHTTPLVREGAGRLLPLPEPFFLLVYFLDPHDPHVPLPECSGLDPSAVESAEVRAGRTFVLAGERNLSEDEKRSGVEPRPTTALSEVEIDYLRALYDCELSAVDRAIEGLLGELPLDRSWVAVTSDHGEEFLEHGGLRHGYSLYEETVRVPLLIRPPGGLTSPVRHAEPVRSIDLLPTLLDRLGIPFDHQALDGVVLPPFGPQPEQGAMGVTRFRGQDRAYLRRGRYKLIVDFKNRETLLFDLEQDPLEQSPIADDALERELLAEIERRIAEESVEAWPRDVSADLDPEAERALRSLGYLGD